MTGYPVTLEDIKAAAARLKPYINRTPVLRSSSLDMRSGGQVLLKAECLQRTGSFKIRGALNRILQLSEEEKAAGVVAYSSGNHAQGVALAAKLAGVSATIVMPEDAPQVKRDRTRRLGAEIVSYDRHAESREDIAAGLAEERGAVLVPPFEDRHIIAGQGTVGLELAEELAQMGLILDALLVPCSGGGLSSGIGLAFAEMSPSTQLITVEPNGFDDVRRSLRTGSRVTNVPGGQSICDALLLPTPGAMTFGILKGLAAEGVAVSDREALGAIRFAAEELRVVVEPGGAVALAALLYGHVEARGKTMGAVLSGGNIDMKLFDEALRYAV